MSNPEQAAADLTATLQVLLGGARVEFIQNGMDPAVATQTVLDALERARQGFEAGDD